MFDIPQNINIFKQMEKALRISEERFNLAMQGSNDGLWDWNLETNNLYLSPRWKQMLGYAEHEIAYHLTEFVNRIHPQDVEITMETVLNYLQKKIPHYEITIRMRHKEGHYIWILARGIAVWNEQGIPYRMVGTHMDLTHTKQSEIALRESEQYWRSLIEEALIGLILMDIEGHFVEVNRTFANIVGYEVEELHTLNLRDLTPIQHDDLNQFLFKQIRETGRIGPTEREYIHKKGYLVPVKLSGCTIYRKGQLFVWCNVEDITEQKQTEAKLQQAKEAAEAANRAKSVFLANMSHELRTPLNGILGYAQILKSDKTLTEQQSEGLDVIYRSGEYLLTLISDILDLSKIEVGRMQLYPTDFQFHDFMRSIVGTFKIRAQQKDICFSYEELSVLPVGVYADEKRLRQIIINLLSNAIKFTQIGGVKLKVGVVPNRDPEIIEGDIQLMRKSSNARTEKRIRFQIEDTGIGIASGDLEKIFLPFQQLGDQHYRAEGTGLGLAITQNLVDMMGGEISISSNLGQGSTVCVELNLLESENFIQTCFQQEEGMIVGFKGKAYKILLVDDKWENCFVLNNFLTRLGFTVTEASHGREALSKAKIILPDVILVDLVMPIMDGFELIAELRQLPEFKNTIIIATSSSIFEDHQQKSLQIGGDDFIQKPIENKILLRCLQKRLRLEWIYEQKPPIEQESLENQEMIPPSQERLATLFKLSRIGDVNGLLLQLEEIESLNQCSPSFITQLRQLVKGFKIKQLRLFVERFMGTKHE